jgi:hypothetical protein
MWVIYRKEKRQVVGMSADGEPELDKDYALEEVVRGLGNAEAVNQYDALLVSDRARQLHIAIEELRLSFLRLSCDAPDVHPVDGIPEIRADGTSFTTITAQKVDDRGKPQPGNSDNDLLYLRTDYGTLFDADGAQEISSIKLQSGQAAFRLVSEKARRVATVQVFNADANLQNGSIRIEFI